MAEVVVNNRFACLDSEAEASTIIEAAEAIAKTAATADKQQPKEVVEKKEQQTNKWAPWMMKARRTDLPAYIRRRDLVFTKEKLEGSHEEKPEGKSQSGVSDKKQNGSVCSDRHERNYVRRGETGDYEQNNEGLNGYRGYNGDPENYRGRVSYRRDYRNQGYHKGGRHYSGQNNGVNSSGDADNDGWQSLVSNKSGRVRRFNENNGNGYAYGVNQQFENQKQEVSAFEHSDVEGQRWGKTYHSRDRKGMSSHRNAEGDGGTTNEKEDVAEAGKDAAEALVVKSNGDGEEDGSENKPDISKKKKNNSEDHSEKKEKVKEEDDTKEMTLQEYEKLQLEKKKASEYLKITEQRKVDLDKDFESMKLHHKRTEDGSQLVTLRKKDNNIIKEERIHKTMTINEFLKPAEGKRGFGHWGRSYNGHPQGRPNNSGRGRGGRSQQRYNEDVNANANANAGRSYSGRGTSYNNAGRGGYGGKTYVAGRGLTLQVDDPNQFPSLGGA